ncbi:MAG TPA: hypothetical protein ENN51_01165 [candidate division WOR-3 bacterium]|uniref:Uncharacterized protein n=1 Tax=candidate division WOR-3 bacterium TaxID=2052148 RepID=A0A7V0XEP9_UNCW3|nr:hypothetical protein [candidate division WOR-3 bacterium]
MFITLVLLSSLVAALPMPEAGVPPPEAVRFEVARDLARRKAAAEWPQARLGEAVPYLDEEGRTAAWFFQFRTDGRSLPGYDGVAEEVRAERELLGPNTDLTARESRYAFVLVSARYDRAPIIAWGLGVSEYYAVGRELQARAAELLGADVALTRLYFDWPRVNFEFGAAGRNVVLSARGERSWRSRADYRAELAARHEAAAARYGYDESVMAEVHRRRWDDYLERDFTDFADVFVPQHQRAPFYDWSYGCTPTSGGMVCGYIDRVREFGRLVDYNFARWELVVSNFTWQIPNAQRECAIAMNTDTVNTGGTNVSWIGPGLKRVIENNGYSCNMVSVLGGSHNDWAWNTVTSEIDRGNAMVWSALWEQHSLAAFGYRTPDKDIYVHNTWWQPAAWWHYSGPDWSYVDSPTVSGGSAYKLALTWPLGDTFYNSTGRGEVLQVGDTAHVTWDNHGNPATRVDIEISHNRGRNWTALATNLPDNGRYAWFVDSTTAASDSVRLRLKQYQGSTLTSADGSFGDFKLVRQPLPPLSLAPPNGRQLFEGGVVLLVDTTRADIDSFEFRLMQSTDTIWRWKADVPYCSLPDSLFTFGRSYKWVSRGRNNFGWGEWGTPWSFWCRFQAGVAEEEPGAPETSLRVTAVGARGTGVRFALGAVRSDARLVLYDALGGRVGALAPAPEVVWDGRDANGRLLPAGLYFARLEDAGITRTVRFLLVE